MNIATIRRLRALRRAAFQARDFGRVDMCDAALAGFQDALVEVFAELVEEATEPYATIEVTR